VQGFPINRPTFSLLHLPSLFAVLFACVYVSVLMIVLRLAEVRRFYEGVRRGTDQSNLTSRHRAG
jgi:hypothetical protein